MPAATRLKTLVLPRLFREAASGGTKRRMRLVVPPGVFRPLSDSRLLAEQVRREVGLGTVVADLCCGSGFLAVTAALSGAAQVTAVDVSRRAVLATRLNARLNGVAVRAVRGDLFAPLKRERFDLIVSNPPYVPADDDEVPTRGPSRGWDAGRDGRAVLDRICAQAPAHLRPGGRVLIVHSSVCDADRTVDLLAGGGLAAKQAAQVPGPLGPLLHARAGMLERRGLLAAGAREEALVVIEARAA
jgi:release factor glutamine methyltransferase